MNLTIKNSKHENVCLISKHELATKLMGFNNFYNVITSLEKYKGSGYHDIKVEFLDSNVDALNPIFRVLTEFIKLELLISDQKSSLINLMR